MPEVDEQGPQLLNGSSSSVLPCISAQLHVMSPIGMYLGNLDGCLHSAMDLGELMSKGMASGVK